METTFVRGELIELTASFASVDHPTDEPSEATLTVAYRAGRTLKRETLSLARGNDKKWRGVWDSSPCTGGRVSVYLKSNGSVIAAAEGSFILAANPAHDD